MTLTQALILAGCLYVGVHVLWADHVPDRTASHMVAKEASR